MTFSPVRASAGVVLVVATIGGCYEGPRPAMGPRTTNNSAIPCMEACGTAGVCKSQCHPTGDLPPPPGMMYQR